MSNVARWAIGIAIGLLVGLAAGFFIGKYGMVSAAQFTSVKSQLQEAQSQVMKLAADKQGLQNELDGINSQSQQTVAVPPDTYTSGTYLVGKDMKPGRYYGKPDTSASSSYWAISSDANGQNIVTNANPSGAFYVQVKNGQYLTLDGVIITLDK